MRRGAIGAALIAGALTSGFLALLFPQPSLSQAGGRAQQSVAAFGTLAKVLGSPRCQNCHTLTDFPRQGDDGHPHLFHATRGGADRGAPGLPCSTCHGQSNNAASGVPGAPEAWRLAPVSMGWEGLSMTDLCRHLKDPRHNGHRNGAEIIDHLKSHLVMWSWSPGSDPRGRPRSAPPIAYADFVGAAETWVRTGAACPQRPQTKP
jgi:hypothetical protein